MNGNLVIIADRIKELRDVLGISTAEIAERLNISQEVYKKYESAESDIPVGVIYELASIFGVDPTELLTGEAPKMRSFAIVKNGEGVKVERTKEYSFTSLAHNFIGREMEPMLVHLKHTEEEPVLLKHSGNEFNFVIKGQLRLKINDSVFILDEGDSAYFDPRLPHSQAAVGDEVEFLTVINDFTVWSA